MCTQMITLSIAGVLNFKVHLLEVALSQLVRLLVALLGRGAPGVLREFLLPLTYISQPNL